MIPKSPITNRLTRERPGPETFAGPPRSDYTLTDFTMNALDAAGQRTFQVSGPRLSRRGDDGSIFVTTPDYLLVDGSGHPWRGTSDAAWVNQDGSLMKLQGHVEMQRLLVEQPAIDVVADDLLVAVVDDGEVGPLAQALRGEHRGRVVMRAVLAPGALHPQLQFAGLADVPVRGGLVPAVGHEEGVELVGQGIDAHPGHQRQRVELSRHVQADAVADALELQPKHSGETARHEGFSQAREILEQNVPACQHGCHHHFEQAALADHGALHLCDHLSAER